RQTWVATDGTQVAKKADVTRRFLALVIDIVIAAILSVIPYLGNLLAAAYLLLRDGFDFAFMDHRSVGKRLMRLRPVCDDGSPVTLEVSARRNWPLAVMSLALFLGVVPVLGFVIRPLGAAAGIILVVLEGYFAFNDEHGLRWGDGLAGTRIIETES
ncbi:MAG: RDD family protein, partial [Deinococcales bacterium]